VGINFCPPRGDVYGLPKSGLPLSPSRPWWVDGFSFHLEYVLSLTPFGCGPPLGRPPLHNIKFLSKGKLPPTTFEPGVFPTRFRFIFLFSLYDPLGDFCAPPPLPTHSVALVRPEDTMGFFFSFPGDTTHGSPVRACRKTCLPLELILQSESSFTTCSTIQESLFLINLEFYSTLRPFFLPPCAGS